MLFLSLLAAPWAAPVSLDALSEGHLIITEVMARPDQVLWYRGEWIEVLNTTAYTVDLDGLEINAGSGSATVLGELLAAPGELIVLASRSNAAINGGNTEVDYQYDGEDLSLRDRATTLSIGYNTDVFDTVDYPEPVAGAAWSLDPYHADADSNDNGLRWCDAVGVFGDGDLGSPGESNPSCAAGVGGLAAGDLRFSEVMVYPEAVAWYRGQWLEIENTTESTVDLSGLVVSDAHGGSVTVSAELQVDAGERVVFAARSSNNGGLPRVDVPYSITDLSLSAADTLTLSSATVALDVLAWGTGDPPAGASLALDPELAQWCPSFSAYGDGDHGTPGSPNDGCDADGDGYAWSEDCDDTDGAIHPGAADSAYDGIDQDCSGADYCASPENRDGIDIDTQSALHAFCDGDVDGVYVDGTLEIIGVDGESDLSSLRCLCGAEKLVVGFMSNLQNTGGLENLSSVGDMIFGYNFDMTALTDMPHLTEIPGQLGFDTTRLRSFRGLESLVSVGELRTYEARMDNMQGLNNLRTAGSIWLHDSIRLDDLSGLESLESVDELEVSSTLTLVSLDGLDALTSAGSLILKNNPALQSLHGLEDLATLERLVLYNNALMESLSPLQLEALGSLEMYGNPSLADISDLLSLTTIDHLMIRDCPITELTGLDNLVSAGTLELRALPELLDLGGLSRLEQVETLTLNDLPIETLDGLCSLEEAGALEIEQNGSLTSLVGLDRLSSVGSLELWANPLSDLTELTTAPNIGSLSVIDSADSLAGLEHLTELNGLVLYGNEEMTDLDPLSGLAELGNSLCLHNTALKDVSGLSGVAHVGGPVSIQYNDALTDLELSSLQQVDGTMLVDGNESLEALSLLSLETIAAEAADETGAQYCAGALEGGLQITDNGALENLDELRNLSSVGWDISVERNDALVSILGLQGISSAVWLTVVDNPVLPSADVLWTLDQIGEGTLEGVTHHSNGG